MSTRRADMERQKRTWLLAALLAVMCPWLDVSSVAAKEPRPTNSAYQEAYDAGRQALYSSAHWSEPVDFAAARSKFEKALQLAQSDRERAAAYVAIADCRLHDPNDNDWSAIRETYAKAQYQKMDAQLGIAETYLQEKSCATARKEFAKAREVSSHPLWCGDIQFGIARSYVGERNNIAARKELSRLLEMKGFRNEELLKAQAQTLIDAINLVPQVRTDHPRLFFNADTWPAVKARALGPEKEYFVKILKEVEAISPEEIRTADWGLELMKAAFVFRVTEREDLLEKVKNMLRATVDHYLGRKDRSAHVYSRIGCVAALDWVWNDLTPAERSELAGDVLRYVYTRHVEDKHRGPAAFSKSPFYYERAIYWYAGLMLLDDGLDDVDYARVLAVLGQGYGHQRWHMNEYIVRRLGDDGAFDSKLEYTFVEIPTVAWRFMHTWRSALEAEFPEEWLNAGICPEYALRSIPAVDRGVCRHFGYSRAWGLCTLGHGWVHDHLGHFVHFFGQSHPQHAAVAQYLRKRIRHSSGDRELGASLPVNSFLLTGLENAPAAQLREDLPPARHFETVGLVLMSSGFGPDDTYALFAAGGGDTHSEHLDTTHFAIYKKGFLALDTGGRAAGTHSINYWAQTAAHNCVLIRMPEEEFDVWKWGKVQANSGGQNRPGNVAKVLAFETGKQFSYVAADATKTYHPDKCSQMVRQFAFLPPNHFVVFDRVTSTKAEYPKRWLLHTSNEPVIAGKHLHADQGQGRIFCRTLYPADAGLEKVGGPGSEFRADGKNWPIPEDWQMWSRGGKEKVLDTAGRWRVEVSPESLRREDCFLHLIQTSDQSRQSMSEAEVSDQPHRIDVSFTEGTRTYRLSFNKKEEVGGHVHVSEAGKVLVDRAFTTEVMPQSGLALGDKSPERPIPATRPADEESPKDVNAWARKLTDRNAQVDLAGDARLASARELVNIGATAVEPLIGVLQDDNPTVRRYAAWALGEIKDARAAKPLVAALGDEDGFVQNSAAEALGKIGEPSVESLMAALEDENSTVRRRATDALRKIGDNRAVEPLVVAMEDNDWSVRRGAARALANTRDGRAVEPLIAALNDKDWRVRRYATWALGEMGAPAIQALIAGLSDPNPVLRRSAAQALAEIGTAAAGPLAAALKDEIALVRGHAAHAIGEIGDVRASSNLLALVDDEDSFVRARAVAALGNLSDPRAVTPLASALNDEAPEVRCAAADALGRIKDARAPSRLIGLLRDQDASVRRSAAAALGEIGDQCAVEPLIAALGDENPRVRSACAEALGKVNDPRAIEPLIDALADRDRTVCHKAHASLVAITGHQVSVGLTWSADVIRRYRQPIWQQWWEKNHERP